MNDLKAFTSVKRENLKVELSNINVPNEGVLQEIYDAYLSIPFNSQSQRKYEQTLLNLQGQTLHSLLSEVFLFRNKNAYTIFTGFRYFEIAKSLNFHAISACIFDNLYIDYIYDLSLRSLLQTALLFDSSSKKFNPAIKSISRYIKHQSSDKLKNLIFSDPPVKQILEVPNYLHRSPSIKINSTLEDRIEAAKDAVDLEFRSYD